jgi:dTDP-4-amino-4,6-dideoxygalactose transaminase
MIPFNVPPIAGKQREYLLEALEKKEFTGDKTFVRKCRAWFDSELGTPSLLTGSCTHSLEMAALLSDIAPGDEVIMPSFTFVSTANAFVLRGATIVFVDVRPDTMNIDESLIEPAVTDRTKAVVPVHYGGVGCEMEAIGELADAKGLRVIEDAAQCLKASYRGRALGTFGDFGAFSFHPTKNYTSGEGGLFVARKEEDFKRAEIVREKGTNRQQFLRGQVDKYTWIDIGSSHVFDEFRAGLLFAQLEVADEINDARRASWQRYADGLSDLIDAGKLEMQLVPEHCRHNAHMFYVKTRDLDERTRLITFLEEAGIGSAFHYVPLHTSPAGQRYGRFHGEDVHTTSGSNRLVRLPMYFGLRDDQVDQVLERIHAFY